MHSTSASYCLFFLHCSRDHPDLHSFPTRRSSDLIIPRTAQALIGNPPPRRVTPVQVTVPPSASDRKSTRLNSSHTVISYAVFCLKKKNYVLLRIRAARAVVLNCVASAKYVKLIC